ncbi:MAG: RlmE family RNA methyltransferase [Gammaproteobacteria bacterium]|jgi:23S rRNA (uridine2552-2'-O)-methyltransferase|nr:RlmE family RNA methyltransferase [Gammaproteobacteria bacterium]
MAKSNKSWLHRQEKDPYAKQARASHYRSRAAYKLSEIDKKDKLFRNVQTVVDVGASPGSWSQYASEQLGPQGKIVAVDILPMEPVDKVLFIEGDFTEDEVVQACMSGLNGARADLVLSDIAPNLSGVRSSDQARSMYLAELVLSFSDEVLSPGGDILVKLFQGEGTDQFKKELANRFQKVMVRKPQASRDSSREFYVLARGYQV